MRKKQALLNNNIWTGKNGCEMQINVMRSHKLHFLVTLPSRKLSILAKLYKQKGTLSVCGNETLSYSWRPLESELSLRVSNIKLQLLNLRCAVRLET